MSFSSPLSKDTRQQPYAAKLLDLQLRGEGAPEVSRCAAGNCSPLHINGERMKNYTVSAFPHIEVSSRLAHY